jgi:serine/threonine protein kinase
MKMVLESGKGPASKPKQIAQKELTDPTIVEDNDYRGKNKKVVRKRYRTTINVACIPFASNETKQEGNDQEDRQLAILSKLSECPNILKFYGLANLDGLNHLIVEWAHYGTLKETYEAYDIPWVRKIHIATDICRAITFLHSAEIYHHDLRCENVMLTINLEPKLSNFEYARVTTGATTSLSDLTKVIHWLAPEKMRNKRSRYDAKCEIFRYRINLITLKYNNYLKLFN